MDAQVRGAGWGLWARWLLASLIGWVVGLVAAIVLSYVVVNIFYPEETNLIVGLVLGAGVGLAQMIAVRRVLPLTQRWVWGAAVGMGIPFIVAVVVAEAWLSATEASDMWLVVVAVVGGALAGLIQAPALRRHASRARWWIPASLVSWGVAWLMSVGWGEGGILVGGLALGAVGGALLVWILRSGPMTADETRGVS